MEGRDDEVCEWALPEALEVKVEVEVLAWPGARLSCPRVPGRECPSVADADERPSGWFRGRPFELRDYREECDCEAGSTDGF